MDLSNKHFNLEINSTLSDCIILKRKKNLGSKPPLYIFDLTRKCYISSLKPTDIENVFNFDVRLKEENNDFYCLSVNSTGRIEVKKIG